MPRVYGIEIAEDSMARNAQGLMHAQVAICGLGALGGIAGVVRYFIAKSKINDWVERSGEADVNSMSNMDTSIVLNCIVAMLLPCVLVLLVRNAIRNNNREILSGVCVLEGVCSFCAALGVLEAVMAIPAYFYMQDQVDRYDCSTASDPTSCESARDPTRSFLNFAIVFVIVQLVIGFCQVSACLCGTVQANSASNALRHGQVFTGVPKIPVMTAVTLGQPVVSTEQNKVVAGQVVVGVPV
jgi:hypothetical protein